MNKAIDYCIEHGILSEFLRDNRAEVLGMLLEEFDVEKYERTLRAEGREEGIEQGREQGRAEAIESSRMKFIDALDELGIPFEQIKQRVMKRFKLSDAEAEERMACL
ncbi:MAG: hypothetical protein NC313_13175 [Butyrivibrio sp.]|nr:hypothetical protein [Butyrivibrio sp.]